MRIVVLFFVLFTSCAFAQIGSFTSVAPGSPGDSLILPETHNFQLLFQEYESVNGLTIKGNPDFTAFIPTYSSDSGYLCVNHELIDNGGVSVFSCYINGGKCFVQGSDTVDFTPVMGTARPCSGGISPWNTLFIAEEAIDSSDLNNDGYRDIGWIVEIDPVTKEIVDQDGDGNPDKLWKLGNMLHENICFANDSTVYFGADNSTMGFVYKFVSNNPPSFATGDLFVLAASSVNGSTAEWIQVPNSTPSECNSVQLFAQNNGATNFVAVEDCEIGPDQKLYFTSKVSGRIYSLSPQSDTISDLTVFVENTDYTFVDQNGVSHTENWNYGADNLAFDNQGNLWVLQDALNYYIWVVGPSHTASSPNVRLFARTPAGGEPTGITFSPDFSHLFISIMHPSISNSAIQHDFYGTPTVFDKGTTLVIARNETLLSTIETSPINIQISQSANEISIPGIELFKLHLYNLNGQLCRESEENNLVRTTGLPAGVYILKATNEDETKSIKVYIR